MEVKYIPILRWKTGEKNCLERLSENTAKKTIPFIEVSPPSDSTSEEDAQKKLQKLINSFNTSWNNKPFYLYLSQDWYINIDSTDQIFEIFDNIYTGINHPEAIPAFDISDEVNISNAKNLIKKNGICLRVSGNDFEGLDKMLDKYVDSSWISPENTDLLLDLKYIGKEIYPHKAALTTAISDIPNIANYRRIIVASCSFPADISGIPSNTIEEIVRHEVSIHDLCLKLQKTFSFNYVYSDYGPMNLNEVAFVLGMSPKFKIKYTTPDKYLVIKGLTVKKGGLDLPNIIPCCKQLVKHTEFSGANFSYGDKIISDIANGTSGKGGNLTNWVEYNFNHHITLIVLWV